MKVKILAIFLIIFFGQDICSQTNNIAKTKVSWGIKADMNFSNFIVSETPLVSSNMKFGETLGGFLNIQINGNFSLQGELLFHNKNSELIRNDLYGKFSYWGTEVPIYAVYNLILKNKTKCYFGIGPYTEFGFSARLSRHGEHINLYKKDQDTDISAMDTSNSGFGFMFGYEFISGLQLNLSYKIGVNNVLDANSNVLKLNPTTLSIGIGYHFH